MNSVNLIGRLTKNPDTRYTQNGLAVARFTLAVDRPVKREEGKQTADFIGCTAFGKTAETIGNNLCKGRQIGVNGRIQTGSYEKDGQRRYTFDVIVDRFTFCGRKDDVPAGGEQLLDGSSVPTDIPNVEDEEIPF